MNKTLTIAPSILSADFLDLRKELQKCVDAGIKIIHYDVMDFDFVPNLTFGSKILKDITNQFDLNIDIHFMIKVKTLNFSDFFNEFIKCKPLIMTMHIESMETEQIEIFIELCKKNKIKPSLAISPNTPVEEVNPYLKKIENILVMSVHPGFGGQAFLESCINKIEYLKKIRKEKNLDYTIEVDGGINETTCKIVSKAGADIVVAGSYLFESSNFEISLEKLND
ncbi:ribulose-phosphate 3-epimerase [Entomoplasma ellychniae]|uniref:Ribulose-phosphate 3-epimerase n=1 Tax=Entomoplasma ellychniae TaxID=2114 RepID=A0A8E2QWL1_9MOLU|nr:ribulose-phosphate 3-epimerase [Entomoplasma ellychniae]PPE05017.1 ribulose-phosphate 3-epimerase [Entomoplasma ellychniae]